MIKKKKAPSNTTPFIVTPPPYEPKTPITDEQRAKLVDEASQHWIKQATYYGFTKDRPDPVTRKIQRIKEAVDYEKAIEAVQQAKNSTEIMILGAWARGQISGPTSEASIERDIKKAQGLVRLFEEKNNPNGVETQKRRIKEFQEQLRNLQLKPKE